MIKRSVAYFNKHFLITIPDRNGQKHRKDELRTGENYIGNLYFLEVVIIAFFGYQEKVAAIKGSYTSYIFMHSIALFIMLLFLAIFKKIGKEPVWNKIIIRIFGTVFAGLILRWACGISLLDHAAGNTVLFYFTAAVAISITARLHPLSSLAMYTIVQVLFLLMLPHYSHAAQLLFSDSVNSTIIITITWAISALRYRTYLKQFEAKKMIDEKNESLSTVIDRLTITTQKYEQLSHTDGLTGVHNRMMFNQIIATEWEKCMQEQSPLSYLMIDVDFFKGLTMRTDILPGITALCRWQKL